MGPLLQATRTVPIVFTNVVDPVGAGFVDSMARPGANATGFIMLEYSLAAKWLELLKEVAPGITRVGVLRDPSQPGGTGQFGVIQSAAPSFKLEVSPLNTRDALVIELSIAAFAQAPKGGLISTAGPLGGPSRSDQPTRGAVQVTQHFHRRFSSPPAACSLMVLMSSTNSARLQATSIGS